METSNTRKFWLLVQMKLPKKIRKAFLWVVNTGLEPKTLQASEFGIYATGASIKE